MFDAAGPVLCSITRNASSSPSAVKAVVSMADGQVDTAVAASPTDRVISSAELAEGKSLGLFGGEVKEIGDGGDEDMVEVDTEKAHQESRGEEDAEEGATISPIPQSPIEEHGIHVKHIIVSPMPQSPVGEMEGEHERPESSRSSYTEVRITPPPEQPEALDELSIPANADIRVVSPRPESPGQEPEMMDERLQSPIWDHAPERNETPTAPVSPITRAEMEANPRDSMASIALSDTSLDYQNLSAATVQDVLATPKVRQSRHMRKPSSLEILQNAWPPRPELERQSTLFDTTKDLPLETPMTPYREGQLYEEPEGDKESGMDGEDASLRSLSTTSVSIVRSNFPSRDTSLVTPHRMSGSSGEEQGEVDWFQLDLVEAQEKEDRELAEGAEDESTAFLLARLEQENAKISAFSEKSVASRSISRLRSESRPPSMGHLKKLVQDRNAPSIRYSLAPAAEVETLPEPPPMTELEFWAALVQDYPSTATRLPTLTTTKIRAGIPPPLRGVVWTSMAGARDRTLEDAFDNLVGEKSPYEGIINKDVGRSFPGVELFRDAEGDGQKMLGRVLKCFSLQDKDIGYCQGLGFLVGPLLMNMGEREAFCVLVRLMDHYSLRASFLPSLSGLHMRIFQFSSLLKQHQPELAAHLSEMGIEPAYLSQWFLSCFAVSCPLPLLFRIYDVIFAEGANETVMRVALALMRRNEEAMLAATEFEEVMQLLLGRAIWDAYACNADDLVDDFTGLGGLITHARLAELEKEYETQSSDSVGEKAGFLPDVQAAASRFLGRLWAPTHGYTPSKSSLSPSTAEKDTPTTGGRIRPHSFLRRSPSKQSISTLNGSDGSTGSGSTSLVSTAPTERDTYDPTRESQADTMSLKSSKYPDSMRTVSVSTGHGGMATPGLSKEERDMHGQIEDLLTALSEMQREHQQMAAMLQKEREERGDDHRVVRQLVKKIKKEDKQEEAAAEEDGGVSLTAGKRKTMPPPARRLDKEEKEQKPRPKSMLVESTAVTARQEIDGLVEKVQERLGTNARFSASFETKAQLHTKLATTREQLALSENSCRDLTVRLETAESSLAAFMSESEDLRSETNELRIRVNEEFKARQKLEHTIRELKAEARSIERKDRDRVQREGSLEQVPMALNRRSSSGSPSEGVSLKRGSISSAPVSMAGPSGLRELKLGRRDSASSVQSLRNVKTRPPVPIIQTERPASIATTPSPASEAESPTTTATPIEELQPVLPTSLPTAPAPPGPPAPALAPPVAPVWHARTSSLATKEVFATPQHEVVPDDALLLELVNAKTAEAQARQEVDEMKRSLTQASRRHDAALLEMRAEIEAARLEASRAQQAAEAARADATAKAEAAAKLFLGSSASGNGNERSVPTTPTATGEVDGRGVFSGEPAEGVSVKKADSASSGGGGGWFWSRRTASTAKIAVTPPPTE